jgi:hypothetical protein
MSNVRQTCCSKNTLYLNSRATWNIWAFITSLSDPDGAATATVADAVSLATKQLAAPNPATSPTPAYAVPAPPDAIPATPILGDARTRSGVGGRDGCGVQGADIEEPLRRTSITSCEARRSRASCCLRRETYVVSCHLVRQGVAVDSSYSTQHCMAPVNLCNE